MIVRVELVPDYDPAWKDEFIELGRELRRALGETALRIDHIGSTAVPGLAAKPIVDVQISVLALEPVDRYLGQATAGGRLARGVSGW